MERNGILIIDKHLGITSRKILVAAQKKLQLPTLGHAGTLDPLASGVLVALAGKARKLQNFFMEHDKEYQVVITLGAYSETDDSEGPIYLCEKVTIPTRQDIENCLPKFQGKITQTPPQYSAVRVDGKRAYDLARAGKEVPLKSRQVEISNITLNSYEYPHLDITVHCGSGTYIRSLARDIGKVLQTGGYVTQLRRTKVGQWNIENATTIEELNESSVFSLEQVLQDFPKIELSVEQWQALRNGQKVSHSGLSNAKKSPLTFIWIAGRIVAIAKQSQGMVSADKLLIANDYEF